MGDVQWTAIKNLAILAAISTGRLLSTRDDGTMEDQELMALLTQASELKSDE